MMYIILVLNILIVPVIACGVVLLIRQPRGEVSDRVIWSKFYAYSGIFISRWS